MTTLADGRRPLAAAQTADRPAPPGPPPAGPARLLLVGTDPHAGFSPVADGDAARRVDGTAVEVHRVHTADQARALARAYRPAGRVAPGDAGLAVVSTALPEAAQLAFELRQAGWRTVVVGMVGDPTAAHAARAARAHALVVVDPPATAVRPSTDAAAGAQAPPPQPQDTPTGPMRPPGPAILSDREVQVLRLVATGRSNRDAGAVLGLSALTVKSHLARIGRKLGTGDRAELVALGMRHGLID